MGRAIVNWVRVYRVVLRRSRQPLIFTLLASVCSCLIVYLTCRDLRPTFQKSLHRGLVASSVNQTTDDGLPFNLGKGPKRLIVFGDSWSDNGQYLGGHPGGSVTDAEKAKVWAEWLCSTISCAHHDNFARPLARASPSGSRGAVVDNTLLDGTWIVDSARLNNTSAIPPTDLETSPADLGSQVQQWLTFERSQNRQRRRSTEAERMGTVFCIWFSLWDIWSFSTLQDAEARRAVTNSIDALFQQLDLIAKDWPSETNIILPDAVDLTFLPSWQKLRTGPHGTDASGQDQRNAVQLVEQWNFALRRRAKSWNKGRVYIYSSKDWLLDQIRGLQLVAGVVNHTDTKPSPWLEVEASCLGPNDDPSNTLQAAEGGMMCTKPQAYLFWDDCHLGPEAMRLLGEDVGRTIMHA